MKVIVATYGTEGDARPFAALCRGLIDAGHEARLLADAATLGSARALGVPTTPLAGDIRGALAADRDVGGVVAKGGGFNATARALATIANANAKSWLRTIVEVGEGCDAVLAAGLAAFAGFSAAEVLGAKAVGAGMIPITPTAHSPPRFCRQSGSRAGSTARATPSSMRCCGRPFASRPMRRARGSNCRRARRSGRTCRCSTASRPPCCRPADWPADVRLCGQWLARSAGWTPPPALANFLAAGDAPIYIGFGSMTGFDTRRLMDALIAALAGRRALFHAGWSGADPKALSGNVFAIGDTPHDWLFPRTAAVIHHGGSGTSHSATRAGAPSIVTPFAGDQFFWAERLRLAGVAPAAVDGRRPKGEAFARALDFAASAQARARARTLGERMRAEDGVTNAVAAIERIVAG